LCYRTASQILLTAANTAVIAIRLLLLLLLLLLSIYVSLFSADPDEFAYIYICIRTIVSAGSTVYHECHFTFVCPMHIVTDDHSLFCAATPVLSLTTIGPLAIRYTPIVMIWTGRLLFCRCLFILFVYFIFERFLSDQLSRNLLDRSSPNFQGW